MIRLLLPFTHGIDVSAITAALALAQSRGATLMVLSLIHLPQASDKGPRWEDIQQSSDFLAFVQRKAARWGVRIEQIALYTCNPVSSILTLAQEMECAGLVLVMRRGAGVLLATPEVKHLLENKRFPLYLVQLDTKLSTFFLWRWLFRGFGSK